MLSDHAQQLPAPLKGMEASTEDDESKSSTPRAEIKNLVFQEEAKKRREPLTLPIGTEFTVMKRLGKGAQAQVYQASLIND